MENCIGKCNFKFISKLNWIVVELWMRRSVFGRAGFMVFGDGVIRLGIWSENPSIYNVL